MPGLTFEQEITEPKGFGLKHAVFWTLLFFFCIGLFTLIKLPEAQINEVIQSQISSQLGQMGIILRAEKSHISLLTGLKYRMEDVNIYFGGSTTPLTFASLEFSPALLKLFTGKVGANITAEQNKSSRAEISVALGTSVTAIDFDVKQLDLGKLEGISSFTFVKIHGVVSGNGSIVYNSGSPDASEGEAALTVDHLFIASQTLSGIDDPLLSTLKIPEVSASKAKINLTITKGKARLKIVLGQKGVETDDIVGVITGDVILGRTLLLSKANLEADFYVSEKLMHSFPLMSGFLAPGKKSDGSYKFGLTGPLSSMVPEPRPH